MNSASTGIGQAQQQRTFRNAWRAQLIGLTALVVVILLLVIFSSANGHLMQVIEVICLCLLFVGIACVAYGIVASIVGLIWGLSSRNRTVLINSIIGCVIGIIPIIASMQLYVITTVVSLALESAHHQPETKLLLQRLEDHDREMDYILLTNARAFEPVWYVYAVDKAQDPSQSMLAQGDSAGSLFENYSEGAHFTGNPNLEIVNTKYLVFWRGGFPHCIFNLESGDLLLNEDRYHWDGSRSPEAMASVVSQQQASETAQELREILTALLHRTSSPDPRPE